MRRRLSGSVLLGALAATLAFIGHGSAPAAEGSRDVDPHAVRVTEVRPHFFVASDGSTNMVVYTGDDVSFVAGVQRAPLVRAVQALIEERRAPRVQYAVMFEDVDALPLGDGGWGHAGAVAIIHEDFLRRMRRRAHPRDPAVAPMAMMNPLPLMGFSHVIQLWLKDEEIHIIHERIGYTNADVVVHFEKSGLLYLGNTFTSGGYPDVDTAADGSLAGIIQSMQFFIRNFGKIPDRIEPIVPGRGPIAKTQDLRDYLEMLTTIRDRVQAHVNEGKTLEETIAARPTANFDDRWGHGAVTPAQFVSLVYHSVTNK
jgi:cyclase